MRVFLCSKVGNSADIKSSNMSILKTLGGDRLGSGKKQRVELHGYERSTHNLNAAFRTTASAGTLIPFINMVALPGDTWGIDLDAFINTHPTVGPLFGSFKVELSLFQVPTRLYNARLHNNELNIGRKMGEVKLPQITLEAPKDARSLEEIPDIDNMQINPSCILAYQGIRGVGFNQTTDDVTRDFNIVSWLMLWDIYKYYYANKQEEVGAVIHTQISALVETIDDLKIVDTSQVLQTVPELPTTGAVTTRNGRYVRIDFTGAEPKPEQVYIDTVERGTLQLTEILGLAGMTLETPTRLAGTTNYITGELTITGWRYRNETDTINLKPNVEFFPLENIDKMRRLILQHDDTVFNVNDEVNRTDLTPYSFITNRDPLTLKQSQEGLPIKTYQSDLFNNWVNVAWMDEITEATRVDTTGGSFTIENLILQKKLYNMYMRVAVSGGTYNDWVEVNYDIERLRITESPLYEGGLVKELVFQEVISNSESESGQPLGTLAGRGILSNKHKGGSVVIKVEEHSYIIGLVSLTPRIDYSKGNEWDTHLQTMEDFHMSGLDGIGFQDLITEQMAWWSTTYDDIENKFVQKSAGKQPAWINYMTNINRTRENLVKRQ